MISRQRIEEMLEECLAAFDAGLTPAECLSAFPEQHDVLSPLLRQALALRVAYAHAPHEEFRAILREKLLFHAGRETVEAFATEPADDFRFRARARLLEAAGAAEQEALRSIPPPRLPFWLNARRRLLDAASRPRQVPAPLPFALALRNGVSAAVVATAIAIAVVAYVGTEVRTPSVSAELAVIDQELTQIEQQTAAGQPVPASVIIELTRRTIQLADKLNTEQATIVQASQAQSIIERQRDVVSQVTASATAPAPALQQAQQQLQQAEEKVRVIAARVDTPVVVAVATTAATAASPTFVPPTPVPATATAGPPPTATPTPLPLGDHQVSISLAAGDNTFGRSWTEVRTRYMTFVIPSSWTITTLATGSGGIAILDGNYIGIAGPGVNVLVNVRSGEVNAIISGNVIPLRDEGPDGKELGLEGLIATGVGPELRHLLDSIELDLPVSPTAVPTQTSVPSATPSPSRTPTASPTQTPAPTQTPTP